MKLGKLIDRLQEIQEREGNIEVQMQNKPPTRNCPIKSFERFFLIPEEYEDGRRVTIRTWPY